MKYIMFIMILFTMLGCTSQGKENNPSLCDINIDKISSYKAQYGLTTGEPERSQLDMLYKQAQQYKTTNDIKNCISTSEQALSIINSISPNR